MEAGRGWQRPCFCDGVFLRGWTNHVYAGGGWRPALGQTQPRRSNCGLVDGSGDVVVTGNSSSDFYTAKYAAADGALLWKKRFVGPAP